MTIGAWGGGPPAWMSQQMGSKPHKPEDWRGVKAPTPIRIIRQFATDGGQETKMRKGSSSGPTGEEPAIINYNEAADLAAVSYKTEGICGDIPDLPFRIIKTR